MTKKELIEIWNSMDDDAQIDVICSITRKNGKVIKILL